MAVTRKSATIKLLYRITFYPKYLQNGIMELTQSVMEIHKPTMKLYKSLMGLHGYCKIMNLHKLDKWKARGHLKSPRSLSGISLHLTFQGHGQCQTPWYWGIEFNRYICLLFRGNRTNLGWDIWQIPHLTLKMQGQGHGQGQIRWSHARPGI